MWRAIGLMSGTSLDGVDAAWIETDGVTLGRLGKRLTLPYDSALRASLRALIARASKLGANDPELLRLTAAITARHAEAVAAIGEPADIIGMHGQTIFHCPDQGRTWQIGDAAWLARATGIAVAHDFRSADVAAGGQGAPLAPIFHAALAARLDRPVAVLNIGGVANLTWIGSDGRLVAFDTGPGNGPLDDWVQRLTGHPFDADGALASAGQADHAVLQRLLAHPYFARRWPKSLDRLTFSAWIAASGLEALGAGDGAATLAAFTAHAAAFAPLPAPPSRWLVTGGGRHNQAIMRALREATQVPVQPVEEVGWDGDALEAQCFGFLAARVIAKLPLSFPETTGVALALVGGRITWPSGSRELRQKQGRA